MGDAMEDLNDWMEYEEDLKSDPWGDKENAPDLDAMEISYRGE